MHALVGAHNGIGRAGLDAQRTANAPVFIDPHHGAGRFGAVIRVEWRGRALGDVRQALNTGLSARWALVDVGLTRCNGLGVTPAIGVAATGALGLR